MCSGWEWRQLDHNTDADLVWNVAAPTTTLDCIVDAEVAATFHTRSASVL